MANIQHRGFKRDTVGWFVFCLHTGVSSLILDRITKHILKHISMVTLSELSPGRGLSWLYGVFLGVTVPPKEHKKTCQKHIYKSTRHVGFSFTYDVPTI